jgi:hypothetical protein
MRSYQLKGNPEILPNGDAVLVPNEQANERILENFRGDGPTKSSKHDQTPRDEGPAKNSGQDEAPRNDGSPSEC